MSISRGFAAAAALSVALATANGAVAQSGPKEQQGGVLGGLLGSVVGAAIPGGSAVGNVISGHSGTIGSMIGSSVGAQLDAEDRAALAAATQAAFETGKPKSFTSTKTRVKATVKIVRTAKDTSGRTCRTGVQTVTFDDGHQSTDNLSLCKGANGNWEV